MADTKISALTAATLAAVANELPINEAGASKKVTLAQIKTLLQTLGMPRVFALETTHTIASTTATEVTGLGPCTLEAGTYAYQFQLILQSATTTVGVELGVNFTGTADVRTIWPSWPAATSTTLAMDDVSGMAGAGPVMHAVQTAFSTTTPNIQNTVGFTTANANVPVVVEGILVVTVSGDLELWHSSETATNTSVMAGSSLAVIRTA